MENTSKKGLFIDAQILNLFQSKKITIQEMLILAEIQYLDNSQGCFAQNKHFAELLGVKKEQVEQHIKSLKKKGFISVSIKDYNKRTIKVTLEDETKELESVLEETTAEYKEDHAPKVVNIEEKKATTYPKRNYKTKYGDMNERDEWDWDSIEEMEQRLIDKKLKEMG